MKQIRVGVFETNSSSTHSICIATASEYSAKPKICFRYDKFGWERRTINSTDNKAAYLWTGITDCFYDDISKVEEMKSKIKDILESENIECEFAEYKISRYFDKDCCDNDGYVDHSESLVEFINEVMGDKSLLLSYLFSPDSFIITGNDNDGYDVEIHVDYPHEEFYKGN